MSYKIVRNDEGNCINFEGSSNPSYWNNCLSAEINADDANAINVINDVVTGETGDTVYEFFRVPYTEFLDADGGSFANAQEAVDYIDAAANVPTDAKTLKHFTYNPLTDKLEADRAIETTLNSLFLGDQHKMSSGSENIYFTNLTTDVNWYPAWGGVKNQGVVENQDMSGVYTPTGRVFGEYGVLALGGTPVAGTAIPYDGDNFFPFNISGMGITTVVAEVVPPETRLKYELSVDGTPVYVQFLEHSGLGIDEPLSWTFDHPLDVNAGSTNHASITKIDADENSLGLLLVCEGDVVPTRYQTTVANRGYEDKNIAFTEDLESLDVVGFYDVYLDPTFAGTADGTNLRPYTTLTEAVNASSPNDKIFVKGAVNVSAEVVLPHSLHFYGIDGSELRYTSYDAANGNILSFVGTDNTQEFTFNKIAFKNAGAYGMHLKKVAKVRIEDCEFRNNGWSGTGLHTVLSSATSGILGYDSSSADLQAFYAGPNASNGGAMRIEEATAVEVIGNVVQNNLRGIRIQDCGVGGYGFVTRNVASQNIESGIYIAAGGTYGGSQNVVVSMNSSAYNANNGLLVIGGLNNKFSQNEVNGNWNAGFCAWGAANSTLRDCGLYDNNRSAFNGIGNPGDAKASIQINEAYNLLGTSISLNPAARFIAEILDTQVHYTGLGSNTEKIGFLVSSAVGGLADNAKNIIKVDDVGFIGQDYAIDLSEVDVSNLRLSFGDNSYQSIGLAAIKPPLLGNYAELPFSNHIMAVPSVDITIDVLKQMVLLKEYVSGNVINTYKANELQAVDMGTHMDIIQKGSDRIQLRGLTFGSVYVDGALAGNTVNSMTNTVNAAFQMDLTEYKEFLVSEVGINAGGTLPAQADNWHIAYGSRAEEQVTSAGVIADLKDVQPFYNGDFLDKGREYTWTHYGAGSYMIGIWSGAQAATTEDLAFGTINWTPGFRYVNSSNRFSSSASTGTDMATRLTAGDNSNVVIDGHYNVVDGSTQLALRYGNDNYLYLLDITGGDDFIIGRSSSTLVGDDVTIFFVGENNPNAQFPVMQERADRWEIVHDFDSSEDSEWADGIEEDTVMRSNMEVSPGEKVTMDFNYFGRQEAIGFGYTGAASGVNNAWSSIDKYLFYNSAEAIKGTADWTWNLDATHSYDPNGDQSDVGYWQGPGLNLGLISWRYKSDNTLEMWHETNEELMATLAAPLDGSPFKVYFGAGEAMPVERIPELVKYDLNAVENGEHASVWYYIESPDGTFVYPLFDSSAAAEVIDAVEGGSGTSQGYSFPDDPTGATWHGPDTSFVSNGTVAPSHGVYGNSTNVLWNEIATNADSTAAPTPFTDAQISIDELAALNFQIHPVDATFTTTIQSPPSWISQSGSNANIAGTAPAVAGDNVNFPSDSYTVTVVRTNAYGSSTGTLTVVVNNLTTPVSLPGTLHAGSVINSSATNSAGKIYLQVSGGHLVYDIAELEDGDKIEWYHQDGTYGFGIAATGVDKTSDMMDHDTDNSAKWDLMAPITGSPTNTNGQNFGEAFSGSQPGLVPLGWDDNTNPQVIPTRPIYAASDVWKLYNNAGTIELSLNGTLFRSSSSTHTDPMITFAMPTQAGSGGVATFGELPSFVKTENLASAPTGFVLDHGTMDTSTLLNGDSVALMSNLSLSPGQRFIAPKTWIDTYVLPFIDGHSGEDNKVFIGVPKSGASWGSVDIADFYSTLRVENQTSNLTKYSKYHAGPSPESTDLNRFSDTDSNVHFGIEFTREGDLVTLWSPDTNPSLTTEPITGTFGHIQTWTGAHSTTGSSSLGLVVGTKGSETRVSLCECGLSVITAPSKANEFDVTEDTFSAPLFNGDPAGDITLAAGTTYKFWLHSDSIESTDALGICLISDNSDYTTGVTVVGTPGSFGSYVEFAIPQDVPPVKFKWTSSGVDYYVNPVISGSTYSVGVTGITFEGPAANQTGTNLHDANDHGWLSIDEPLGAGQRLVLSGAFLSDVADAMADNSIVSIGVKDTGWANTISGVVPSGFEGGMRISIYRVSATNFQLYGYNGDNSTLTTTLGGGTLYNPSQFLNYNAFLEVTSSGNNVRVGYALTSTNDATTTAYANWGTTTKIQSGDQGYGISTVDVMVQSFATSGTGTTDANDIDWTALSEISIPATPTNNTDWTKALDFSGSNEHAKQVTSSTSWNALRMGGLGVSVASNADSNYTSSDTNARPWASTIVFKSDRNSSNQHVWNLGQGASSGNNNMFLRQDASGNLYFGWGREGSGYNECTIATAISSSNWYGVYVAHKGGRFGSSDATASNLSLAFDIRIADSSGSWALSANKSTVSNWTSTGVRTNRNVIGDFTIAGRGSNRNWHGKVASTVLTTLQRNVVVPTDAEISLMITDPIKWEADYKTGHSYRAVSANYNNANFQRNDSGADAATQMWLMGDGTGDSFSNGIRSQINYTNQNQTKLQLNSMASNDIQTVTVTGLS